MIIKNIKQYPQYTIYDPKDFKIIGKAGDTDLILVGIEPKSEDWLVAKSSSGLDAMEVNAISLSVLFKFTYDIEIFGEEEEE